MKKYTFFRIALCLSLCMIWSCSKDNAVSKGKQLVQMTLPGGYTSDSLVCTISYNSQNQLTNLDIKHSTLDDGYRDDHGRTYSLSYTDGKITRLIRNRIYPASIDTIPFVYKADTIFTMHEEHDSTFSPDTLLINKNNQLIKSLNETVTEYQYDDRGNQTSMQLLNTPPPPFAVYDNQHGFASKMNIPSWFASYLFDIDPSMIFIGGLVNNASFGGVMYYDDYNADDYPTTLYYFGGKQTNAFVYKDL